MNHIFICLTGVILCKTVVLLINRLPIPLLNNKSPFKKLSLKIPYYSRLKTFGCLAYQSTSSKNQNKFQHKARACVFIAYQSGCKGYKLLDLKTQSVSVSRHVVFYENIFPYASSTITDDAKTLFPHLILLNMMICIILKLHLLVQILIVM